MHTYKYFDILIIIEWPERKLMADVKAINIFCMDAMDHAPYLHIEGEPLLYSNFFPGQHLKAEISENKIVITPLVANKNFKLCIK